MNYSKNIITFARNINDVSIIFFFEIELRESIYSFIYFVLTLVFVGR